MPIRSAITPTDAPTVILYVVTVSLTAADANGTYRIYDNKISINFFIMSVRMIDSLLGEHGRFYQCLESIILV